MKKLMVAFAAAATVFVASADDTLLGIASTFEAGGDDDSAYWSGDNDGTTNAYDVVGTHGSNYLSIDTADVYARNINTAGTAVAFDDSTEIAGIYVDTMVQFTASEDAPAVTEGDKLVVWLRENDADPVTYTLMVTAGEFDDVGNIVATNNYATSAIVEPGAWYNLQIKAWRCDADGLLAGFSVAVDGNEIATTGPTAEEGFAWGDLGELDGDTQIFPSLVQGNGALELTSIGFKGTGAIDDLAFYSYEGEEEAEEIGIAIPVAVTGLVYDGTEQTGVAAGTGYTLSGTYQATAAGTYTAYATLDDGYYWLDAAEGDEYEDVEIEWTIAEAQGKTDAEKVAEDIAELDGATSGDVVLPNDATVSVSGNTVTVTIGEASDTFTVPEYYDVSVAGSTVTLVLNDLALPTIADTVVAEVVTTPAIQVVNGEIKLNVTSARDALWYGLKVAAALPAEWDSIVVETWVSGDGLTTLTGDADDDAGFYKIVVTDVDPTL